MSTDAHPNYIKVWLTLVGLLVLSVLGPIIAAATMSGHLKLAFVLIFAFGIAFVKAWLVVHHFMHIRIEPRFVPYLFGGLFAFMAIMFVGIAPDVLRHEGLRWSNDAAKAEVERGLAIEEQHHRVKAAEGAADH